MVIEKPYNPFLTHFFKFVIPLSVDNWRTGALKLQHDVTCMGFCKVTAICVSTNPIEMY
jgi:hypothetical protein